MADRRAQAAELEDIVLPASDQPITVLRDFLSWMRICVLFLLGLDELRVTRIIITNAYRGRNSYIPEAGRKTVV